MDTGSVGLLLLTAVVSFVLALIGGAVGLVLGHLRLPLLIAYLGSPGAGAMTNLLISGCGALGGSAGHLRAGRVSWAGLALLGIPSVVGAVVAVLIFVQVNPLWSYLVIGVMLLVSGVNLIRRKGQDRPAAPISRARRLVIEVVIGLALGALAAVTGLMLGSLRLPMMIRYLGMDPKEAVGTNMAVGCLTALAGTAVGLLAGPGHLNGFVLVAVVPPTLLGGYLGGWLTGRLSKEAVQRAAGGIIAGTGVVLAGQGVDLAVRRPPSVAAPLLVEESEYDGWFDLDDPEPDEAPAAEGGRDQ
jgi:uncharacterized membrane protein YfcA